MPERLGDKQLDILGGIIQAHQKLTRPHQGGIEEGVPLIDNRPFVHGINNSSSLIPIGPGFEPKLPSTGSDGKPLKPISELCELPKLTN